MSHAELHNHKLTNSSSDSPAIDMEEFGYCIVVLPSTWTTANLTFYTVDGAGTRVPLYNAAGTALSIASAAASRAYAVPAEALWVKTLVIVHANVANNDDVVTVIKKRL